MFMLLYLFLKVFSCRYDLCLVFGHLGHVLYLISTIFGHRRARVERHTKSYTPYVLIVNQELRHVREAYKAYAYLLVAYSLVL